MEKKYRMIEPSDKTKENEDGIVEKMSKIRSYIFNKQTGKHPENQKRIKFRRW